MSSTSKARLAVAGAASAALLLLAGTGTADARPVAAPDRRPAAVAAAPSYATWIADVTAVTTPAAEYLGRRLSVPGGRTAIVLDIDNTSLETYYSGGITTPAVKPVLALATLAKAKGAAVFFVSDRTEVLRWPTEGNLKTVGYPLDRLYLRPLFNFDPVQTNKTKARAAIEQAGYTIVANIGNNPTDLDGGHAERTFKLPDYNGTLS
ncbi:HAD family acid phosphatase [Amycolatopsis sp. A133]|uniref:HAD family acid phosphatase n=1 Tax=Amycolatopsis sp. A133 TaxID=3064472 RepID=UPI0027E86863|nr:HAD family acid phosphatase [Amycolatopsis sp. A133]MDQ7803545.1 HAD family acid phosphatase [Amycolatopsis sp. A133]